MESKFQNNGKMHLYTVTVHMPLTGPFGGPYDKLAYDAHVEVVGEDEVPYQFDGYEEDEPLINGKRNRYTIGGATLNAVEIDRLEQLGNEQTVTARTPEDAASWILGCVFGPGTAYKAADV